MGKKRICVDYIRVMEYERLGAWQRLFDSLSANGVSILVLPFGYAVDVCAAARYLRITPKEFGKLFDTKIQPIFGRLAAPFAFPL